MIASSDLFHKISIKNFLIFKSSSFLIIIVSIMQFAKNHMDVFVKIVLFILHHLGI